MVIYVVINGITYQQSVVYITIVNMDVVYSGLVLLNAISIVLEYTNSNINSAIYQN